MHPYFIYPFNLIVFSTVALGLGTLIILALVVYLRIKSELQALMENKWIEEWNSLLAQALIGSPVTPPVLLKEQWLSFAIAWNHFIEHITGEAKQSLSRLGSQVGLQKWARKKINSRSLFEQGLALITLGNLKDESSWQKIANKVPEDTTVIGYLACQALVRIDPDQSAPLVIPVLFQREMWPKEWRAMLMKEMGAGNIAPLVVAEIEKTPNSELPQVLDFLTLIPETYSLPLLSDLINNQEDPELVAACLRAWHKIGSAQEFRPLIESLLSHPYWPIRVQAVSLLAMQAKDENDVALLVQMLSDENWWVRFRAAQNLVHLPFMTKEKVLNLLNTVQDRYGRDILEECIREREVSDPGWQ